MIALMFVHIQDFGIDRLVCFFLCVIEWYVCILFFYRERKEFSCIERLEIDHF